MAKNWGLTRQQLIERLEDDLSGYRLSEKYHRDHNHGDIADMYAEDAERIEAQLEWVKSASEAS